MEPNRYTYAYLASAAVILIVGGTVFFHALEKWSWVNAYYFCVVTLTTVGYGDIVPKTDIGKIAITIYILLGIGVISTFVSTTVRRRGAKRTRKHELHVGQGDEE